MVGKEEDYRNGYRMDGRGGRENKEGGRTRRRRRGSGCFYLLQLGAVGGEPTLCSDGENLDQMLAPLSPVLT